MPVGASPVAVAAGGPGWRGQVPCRGASGAQFGPMRSVCARAVSALLGPARAANAVTFKSRQQASVLCDLQWQ